MQLDVLLRGGQAAGAGARIALEDARRDAIDLGQLADALLGLADAAVAWTSRPHRAMRSCRCSWRRRKGKSKALARERTVRIEQHVDETSVRVSGVRFHQALTNLLANAVRHGPDKRDRGP